MEKLLELKKSFLACGKKEIATRGLELARKELKYTYEYIDEEGWFFGADKEIDFYKELIMFFEINTYLEVKRWDY